MASSRPLCRVQDVTTQCDGMWNFLYSRNIKKIWYGIVCIAVDFVYFLHYKSAKNLDVTTYQSVSALGS